MSSIFVFIFGIIYYFKYSNKKKVNDTSNIDEKEKEKIVFNIKEIIENIIKLSQSKINNIFKVKNKKIKEEKNTILKNSNGIKEELKDEEIELTYNNLFQRFIDYIQLNKTMRISEISNNFKLSVENTKIKLRELENEGNFIGCQEGDDYFFLTQKEIDLLSKIVSGKNKKKFKISELEKLFQEIIKEHDIFVK